MTHNRKFQWLVITIATTLSFGDIPGFQGAIAAHPEKTYGPALPVHKVPGIGPCQAVEVDGNRLYATGRGKFYVFDISDPSKPEALGELSGLGGQTRQIFIQGTTAFITARQDGLWLIDISDASQLRVISHYDTVEMATGIWVSGDLAFVATRQYGIEIIDVSDKKQPSHISVLNTGEAQSCWARDGLLYIGDWAPRKMLIADVRNPRKPVIIGEAELDGFGDGGSLRGDYCFAATGHHSRGKSKEETHGKGHGLEIYNVSNPQKPSLISRVKFPPSYQITNDMWTSRVSGNYCVVADTWNGLFAVNISKISDPRIVAHALLPPRPGKDKVPDPVGGIALGDGVIYAAGIFTGLYVVSAPGIAQPVIREVDKAPVLSDNQTSEGDNPDFLVHRPGGQVRSVTIDGDIAWTACGVAGIQAISLKDERKALSVTQGKGEVFHVAVSGNRLYAAENAAGLAVYKIGKDHELTEISRLKLEGKSIKQVACPAPGRFALFHTGTAQALIADFSDLNHPHVVLRDSGVGLFYGDQLVPEMIGGRYLVAFWHRNGPGWYDVSGNKPTLFGYSPDERLFSFADGACAYEDKLLVVTHGKMHLLEPGDMRQISKLPAYGVKGRHLRGRPTTNGQILALSRRPNQEVSLFDISNIEKPIPLRNYKLKGHPGACGFWRNRLVVPAGYQGLLIEKTGSLK